MRLLLGVLVAALLLASGAGAGWVVARETEEAETVTTTRTETTTATETEVETLLPEEVEEVRAALLEAAESGDYEALRPHLSTGFRYTFGGPVEGGPIAYWQELERSTGQKPLELLASILRMPYVLSRGIYVWPFAYTAESSADLTEHERELLAPLGDIAGIFAPGTGYLGWRTGIQPDGTWAFFVAGD